jgi:hypothetical protein
MDKLAELTAVVQQVVEEYAKGKTYRAVTYPVSDSARQTYTVVVVPDYPSKFKSGVSVMARVVGDTVIVDEDITDRPLSEALLEAGIPREKIILAYIGEQAPAQG